MTNQLAGYRVVRKLGVGSRCEVFLGLPGNGPDIEPGDEPGDRTVALKLFRPGVPIESMDTEVAALSRLDHPHLLHIRDLASSTGGRPCLVLERLEHRSLATLLESRESLSAGEAVSLVAPIATAVSVMHADGVAHGAIRPAAVLFRPSGAAVLTGFGHATLIPIGATVAALGEEPAVGQDYRSLARLTRLVLERVRGDRASRLSGWIDHTAATGYPDRFAEVLVERVFGLGEAEPVSTGVHRDPPAIPARIPMRDRMRDAPAALAGPSPRQSLAPAVEPAKTSAGLEKAIARLPLSSAVRSRLDRLKTVRKPVWLVGGAGAAVLSVVLLFGIPSAPAEHVAKEEATAAPSSATMDGGVVTGDDPVAALAVLLETRETCIRDLSVLCLDSVLQDGSAAMNDDIALVESLQAGGELPIIAMTAGELVERTGDAALVLVSDQSDSGNSVKQALMIKGDSGWRIRSLLTKAAAS